MKGPFAVYVNGMDELVKQGQWWWLLIPLGTGVFALIGSWLGSFLGRTTEHKQWLRNQKQEAYSEFMVTAEGQFNKLLMAALDQSTELDLDSLDMTRGRLKLIAHPEVRTVAGDIMREIGQAYLLRLTYLENLEDTSDSESVKQNKAKRRADAVNEILDIHETIVDHFITYVEKVRVDLKTYERGDDDINEENRILRERRRDEARAAREQQASLSPESLS